MGIKGGIFDTNNQGFRGLMLFTSIDLISLTTKRGDEQTDCKAFLYPTSSRGPYVIFILTRTSVDFYGYKVMPVLSCPDKAMLIPSC